MTCALYTVGFLIVGTNVLGSIPYAICNKSEGPPDSKIHTIEVVLDIGYNLFLGIDLVIILVAVIRIWRA